MEALRAYQQYRPIIRELHNKIIHAYVNKETIFKAASMLGLLEGKRAVVVDTMDDISVLMDFALYEIPDKSGKNIVERYAEEQGGSDAEKELLAAMLKAQTGLFKVRQVLRKERQIIVDHVIEPGVSITLTDINLSQTLRTKAVFFFRPLNMTTFTMSSGVFFAFPVTLEAELIRHWKRLESGSSAKRFAWFFKLSKVKGFETGYR